MSLTIQDKILNVNDPVKRKMRNYKLVASGNEARVIWLHIDSDIFEDANTIEVLKNEELPIIMPELSNIPLSRFRHDLSVPITTQSQQSIYMFDILPITVTAPMQSTGYTIEKNDIFVYKLYDDTPLEKDTSKNKALYLTLQLLEPLGSFSPKSLVNLVYQFHIYTQPFPQDVIDIINSY